MRQSPTRPCRNSSTRLSSQATHLVADRCSNAGRSIRRSVDWVCTRSSFHKTQSSVESRTPRRTWTNVFLAIQTWLENGVGTHGTPWHRMGRVSRSRAWLQYVVYYGRCWCAGGSTLALSSASRIPTLVACRRRLCSPASCLLNGLNDLNEE